MLRGEHQRHSQRSMKALIPTGKVSDMVRLADVDEPASAANELVVVVDAFSINRVEAFLLDTPLPHCRPGKDIAGHVVGAAADGSGPQVGTRVVAHPAQAGWEERLAVATSS